MQCIAKLLQLEDGVLAVVGSGGKTTLLATLAEELYDSVILTTSTHLYPFKEIPTVNPSHTCELKKLLTTNRVLCCGTPLNSNKLGAPSLPFDAFARCARHVLIEADGAHRLALKAHAAYEPVIPSVVHKTVLVLGAAGFGKPICQAVHRPELFCALTNTHLDDIATPEAVALLVAREKIATTIFLNQVEDEASFVFAQQFRHALDREVLIGSLHKKSYRFI